MAAKQCWSSNRIGQTCSVPLREIPSHWPTILLPEKAGAVPLRLPTALNEPSPRRHSERSPRSEESLLRFRFLGAFLRGFLRLTRRYSPFPARASLSCSAGSFSRIICSTRFHTARSHSISVLYFVNTLHNPT